VSILDASSGCTDGRYNPTPLTIRTNTVVTWTNSSGEPHTATSNQGVFDTGNIGLRGTSKGILFSRPGTYEYHCAYHSCMKATVLVT
jgi:plastocyanin